MNQLHRQDSYGYLLCLNLDLFFRYFCIIYCKESFKSGSALRSNPRLLREFHEPVVKVGHRFQQS
jgi:hypothetical protein